MGDMIDRDAVIAALLELSPTCREPQVYMDRPHCNCWNGINQAAEIVLAMPTVKGE